MKKKLSKKVTRKAAQRKRRHCPSCGLAFLKGRLVLRITASGNARQRVCQKCASLAVPVLAADAPALCEVCGKNHARFCGACVGKGIRYVQAAAKEMSPEEWE